MAKKKPAVKKKTSSKAKPAVRKASSVKKRTVAKPASKSRPAPKKAAKPAPKAKVKAKKAAKPAPKKVVKAAPKKVAKSPVKKPVKPVIPTKKAAQKPVAPTAAKPVKALKPAPKVPPAKPVPVTKAPGPAPKATAPVKAAPSKGSATPVPAKAAPLAAPVAKTPAVAKEKAKAEPKPKEPVIAVMTGIEPLGAPARTLKRPMKERFLMEFYLRATPSSLYDLISSPSGFSEWFCDDVDVRGDHFTFRWGSDEQVAQCLSRRFGELIRFQWETDEDPGSFFELRIRIDPMTNETCLVVTDHAWPKDLEEAKALWNSQIHTLQRVLGA